MSPVCTFCSVCASVPSCAPGYWLVDSVPLLSSDSSLAEHVGAEAVGAGLGLVVGERELLVLRRGRAGASEQGTQRDAAQQ